MSGRSYEITADGLAALEAEIEEIEGPGRRAMADRIRTARAWGDLKENAEYHDAKNAQAHLETKLLRLQDRRRNAIVVEVGKTDGAVALGSTVVARDEASGRETTYVLVTATEAAPTEGKLSIEAPLARSLMGAREGDVVDFEAPRGTRSMRVLSVK
ncbi:MAG: transcription elongation factor GreA [Solirubrobacteraceae bacterium]